MRPEAGQNPREKNETDPEGERENEMKYAYNPKSKCAIEFINRDDYLEILETLDYAEKKQAQPGTDRRNFE